MAERVADLAVRLPSPDQQARPRIHAYASTDPFHCGFRRDTHAFRTVEGRSAAMEALFAPGRLVIADKRNLFEQETLSTAAADPEVRRRACV